MEIENELPTIQKFANKSSRSRIDKVLKGVKRKSTEIMTPITNYGISELKPTENVTWILKKLTRFSPTPIEDREWLIPIAIVLFHAVPAHLMRCQVMRFIKNFSRDLQLQNEWVESIRDIVGEDDEFIHEYIKKEFHVQQRYPETKYAPYEPDTLALSNEVMYGKGLGSMSQKMENNNNY